MEKSRVLPFSASRRRSCPDQGGAKTVLKSALRAAENLYSSDTDQDDPNQAFKGTWSSTHLWRRCVQAAVKISPDLPLEIIAGIRDLDIATFEKMYYAVSLLGTPQSPTIIAERRKSGMSSTMTQ